MASRKTHTHSQAKSQKPHRGSRREPSRTRFSPVASRPIGILGGGQLARMMVLKGHELGLKMAVLSARADDPAAQVTSLWRKGKLDSSSHLSRFIKECSVVTFESEFLDARMLADLERSTGTPILPKPRHMALLQDRLSQKNWLEASGLPTARFSEVSSVGSAERILQKFPSGVVFKKRHFGYDGYGTFVVRSTSGLKKFLPELELNPSGFIGEEFIPFRREIALILVRSQAGDLVQLPFVETHQENARCLWVKGPLKTSPVLKSLAQTLKTALNRLGYAGAMGVEIFSGPKGLLINELAPRVHNSGHYSLDALTEDQFSLHLRAVLGLGLREPKLLRPGFAMLNLLGTSQQTPSWKLGSDYHLHWYGKSENRPGRKMGHLNALAGTPEAALKYLLGCRRDFAL